MKLMTPSPKFSLTLQQATGYLRSNFRTFGATGSAARFVPTQPSKQASGYSSLLSIKAFHPLPFTLFICLMFLLSSCTRTQTCFCEHKSITQNMETTQYKNLKPEYQKLLDAAEAVMKNSYNPYSNFFVGSALLTLDDEIISGTNFENSAYGSTICAERSAILRANAMGQRKFKAIAIIGRGKDFDAKEPIAPCGACRQVIYESSQLSNTDLVVIMSNTHKDKIIIARISQLLPMAFGPKDLGIDLSKY